MQAVKIGDNEFTNKKRTAGYFYAPDQQYKAISDTGSSLIHVPGGLGYELAKRIVGNDRHSYDPVSGIMITYCEDKINYQDVYLWIDGKRF